MRRTSVFARVKTLAQAEFTSAAQVKIGVPAGWNIRWGRKKKMRSLGSVQIPTDTCPQAGVSERNRRKAAALGAEMAFLAVLKLDE